MINEFKFFRGTTILNDNTLLFQTLTGLMYNNIAGEVINAASNLQDRVRDLEEEVRYMRDHVNILLLNEI
jgi:hypothetical protein